MKWFPTKQAADNARNRFSEYVSEDDDRRRKTVEFDELPDDVHREICKIQWHAREERAPQVELTEFEKERVTGRGHNVVEARSVKGFAYKMGITDWLSHWDPALSVGENKDNLKSIWKRGSKMTAGFERR